MKVYTRTGDGGTTSLLGGPRVAKDDERLELLGCLDELGAVLGMLRSESLADDVCEQLQDIQRCLLRLGGSIADTTRTGVGDPRLSPDRLERWIDTMDEELKPLRSFLLMGGTRAAAVAHVARCVCRRAERRAVAVSRTEATLGNAVLPYLNRLADALFTLARLLNAREAVDEQTWSSSDNADP